jgi:subtilisin family serine protease
MTPSMFRALLAVLVVVSFMTTDLPSVAALSDSPGRGQTPGFATDVVIVGFEPGASKGDRGKAAVSVGATEVRAISPLARETVVMTLLPGLTVGKAIEKLEKQAGVKYAEPNFLVQATEVSNDPHYTNGNLWGMYGDATSPANLFGSGAGEAWATGAVGSPSVFVGVIDEGVQISHPDLTANIWTNPFEIAGNGIDDDGNGYIDDVNGWDFYNGDKTVYDGTPEHGYDTHGTHVAGTIGAQGGNGVGVAGVNWNVTLISAKFLGPDGRGDTVDAIAAIDYLTDLKTRHSLNIVATNNSWGYLHTASMGTPSQALAAAINRAGDRGILFVAAAGNDGVETKTLPSLPAFLPAGYQCTTQADGSARGWDCIVSVASITSGGRLSSFSNYGTSSVDLGAPGSSIWSTYPSSTYGSRSGTSMATPHVAGAVALCASLDPGIGASTLLARVLGTGNQTSSLSGKTVTGDRLDIGALVQQCGVTVPEVVDTTPAEAASLISATGLDPLRGPDEYHPSIAAGRVARQDPLSGSQVEPATTVSYFVSLGVEPTPEPTPTPSPTPEPTPEPTPTPSPTPEPTPEPTPTPSPTPHIATTVVVDDLSPQFVRRAGGWKQGNSGFRKHHFWVPTRRGTAKRIGEWRPELFAPGTYRVVARIPSKNATTRRAVYRIKTADGWVKRKVKQNESRGDWVKLGVFSLTTEPVVGLTARTGERRSLARRVAFDAIRFVPVAPPQVSSAASTPMVESPVQAEPTLEPTPEPTKASTPEPTPETAKEPVRDPQPKPTSEPGSTQEPTPEPTPEPPETAPQSATSPGSRAPARRLHRALPLRPPVGRA